MENTHLNTEKTNPVIPIPKAQRPGARLKYGVDTVLIGFKGPSDLKENLERCAKKLGMKPSEALRAITEDFIKSVEKSAEHD